MSYRKLMARVKASNESQVHSVELVARWFGRIMSEGIRLTKNAHLVKDVVVIMELYQKWRR